MGKINEYLERAKDLAEDAGEVTKDIAGEVTGKAKELMDEHSKARELVKSAKDHTSAITLNAKEKVQGMLQDVKAVKEISLGISELEAMRDSDDSILFKMELETMLNYLKNLVLVIQDGRMDDESVAEEIREVMDKVRPADDAQADTQTELQTDPQTDEDPAIERAKEIAYDACARALGSVRQ